MIPLSLQSHYSLLNGLSRPTQIADRLVELGYPGGALVDYNLSGCVAFYNAMTKAKLKPIFGLKVRVKDLGHVYFLTKNKEGWKSLLKISYTINSNALRSKTIELVASDELPTEGLIVISSLVGTTLHDLFNNRLVSLYADNYYHTNDLSFPEIYYCKKEDAIDHRILLCTDMNKSIKDIINNINEVDYSKIRKFFESSDYYIKSNDELKEIYTAEQLSRNKEIFDKVENFSILNDPILPSFVCPTGYTPTEWLRQLCREGWKKKIATRISKEAQAVYVDRIKYELSVIEGAKLENYFLIVADLLGFVRNKGWLPGAARGSSAGCLISYLTNITSVDPIKYNLIFERFYDAARQNSLPDIDIDVPIQHRAEIIEFLRNKYGKDNVAQLLTFQTMKGRSTLRNVFRSYNDMDFAEVSTITEEIPNEAEIADDLQTMKEEEGSSSIIKWALENKPDKFREYAFIEDGEIKGQYAARFEQAIRLESTKISQSKHAAGVVIGPKNLGELCPMVYDKKDKQLVCGLEMFDAEAMGLIKLDCLGLAMLDKVMGIKEILGKGYI